MVRTAEVCPTCGRPKTKQVEAAERFYKYLLHCFVGDETATGVITDAFRVMAHPQGGGCTNHLDAFLNMCRSVVGEYGNLPGRP